MSRPDGRVLIIGGGLIGCATAWHLALAGARVLLVEQGELNSGASGQNAGSLHFQIERRFLENGEEATAQAVGTVALNAAAIHDWRQLETALEADLGLCMHGGLMVAETADEVSLLEHKTRREQAAGIGTRLIDGREARELCPALSSAIVAAALADDEGHADPRLVTLAYARAAVAAGASICSRTRVASLQFAKGSGFRAVLESDNGNRTESADQVVIAAGGWSAGIANLLNLHLPLFPIPLQMNATERARPLLTHLLQHVGKRLSMKQTGAGNILIGGGWPARLRQAGGQFDLSARPELLPESVTGNLEVAVATVPAISSLSLLRSWTGMTAVSADQLPLVGEIPRIPGCYVAAGGSAFTLGPTFARLLSRSMGGQVDALLGITAPARFSHLNSFMG